MPPVVLPRVLTPPLSLRFGITRAHARTELRRGNWHRIAPSVVLTRPDEPTREDWADVGIYLAGRGSALTGWDALRAQGLGDRVPPSSPVVVLSPSVVGRVVGGVRIRETKRSFTTKRVALGEPYELVPVVRVARAIADAALSENAGRTLAVVTQAVQRRRCSIDDLRAEYENGPRQHSAGLRSALEHVLDGARSIAEARAASRLASGPIPAFELNVPVVDGTGCVLFVIDILWRELLAGVEIDSREHHFGEAEWQKTLIRHNALTARGLSLLHFAPTLVTRRGSTFVLDVAQWLRRRGRELGVPMPTSRGALRPASGEPVPLVLPSLPSLPHRRTA